MYGGVLWVVVVMVFDVFVELVGAVASADAKLVWCEGGVEVGL